MLLWHGDKIQLTMRDETRKALKDVALATEAVAKSLMKRGGRTESGELATEEYTTKTGRKRRRRIDPRTGKRAERTGTYHSTPGEPPRVQTGTLRRSITYELHPVLPIARVGTNVEYGKWLEIGVRGGKVIVPKNAKMLSWIGKDGKRRFAKRVVQGPIAPRPFMRPAYMMVAPYARMRFASILNISITVS